MILCLRQIPTVCLSVHRDVLNLLALFIGTAHRDSWPSFETTRLATLIRGFLRTANPDILRMPAWFSSTAPVIHGSRELRWS
jgi:hypothetical protein